tara:strand:+ start:3826 stop:4137 length:312 start_codon:yes stop_codon:yes gene_type:complete
MLKLTTAHPIAILLFIGLMLFCTPPSYSKEAMGTATANVVSEQNVAIVDFADNEVCIGDNCRDKAKATRTVCQGNDDVFRECLERQVERFQAAEARRSRFNQR